MIWSATVRTMDDGMAKPMPAAASPFRPGSDAARVGIPMTSPSRSTSAPPLLPGLMAAEVWIMLGMVAPVPPVPDVSLTVRPVAETIPWVTLEDSPSGEPIASTICPTCTSEESPNLAGRRPSGIRSSLMTARSCSGKDDTRRAVSGRLLWAVVTRWRSSPPTTWALVTMCPRSS